MKLKVSLKPDRKNLESAKYYTTTINADNYKELSLIFFDLQRQGLPIKKAINEFKLSNSDWNAALGL